MLLRLPDLEMFSGKRGVGELPWWRITRKCYSRLNPRLVEFREKGGASIKSLNLVIVGLGSAQEPKLLDQVFPFLVSFPLTFVRNKFIWGKRLVEVEQDGVRKTGNGSCEWHR